jgi:hypothetical protein
MLALASLASLVVASLYVRSVDDKKWSLLTVLKSTVFAPPIDRAGILDRLLNKVCQCSTKNVSWII